MLGSPLPSKGPTIKCHTSKQPSQSGQRNHGTTLGHWLSRLLSLSLYCVKGSAGFLQVTRVVESLHRLSPTAPPFPAVPATDPVRPWDKGQG